MLQYTSITLTQVIIKGDDLIFPFRDEICRQEFQYAKKTVKKPVIPVVVGSSFDWMMTVVGLLIAGEIYIHFSNKDVQETKMTELLKAIKKSVPQVRVPGSMGSTQGRFDKNILRNSLRAVFDALQHEQRCSPMQMFFSLVAQFCFPRLRDVSKREKGDAVRDESTNKASRSRAWNKKN